MHQGKEWASVICINIDDSPKHLLSKKEWVTEENNVIQYMHVSVCVCVFNMKMHILLSNTHLSIKVKRNTWKW